MGVAVSAYRLLNANPEGFRRDITNLTQLSLLDPMAALDGEAPIPGLPTATSELGFEGEDAKGVLTFRATHYTETKVQAVRVFFDRAIEQFQDFDPPQPERVKFGTGFQEIHRFKVILDFNRREILGFHKKEIVASLLRRLYKANRLDYESITLDFSRIREMPNVTNVFGEWIDGHGLVKKKGLFGAGVDIVKPDPDEHVTSYHMTYQHKGRAIDLWVSQDCKLGSPTTGLTNADILAILRDFQDSIGTPA